MNNELYDFIVVGAGAAGCVVASRLSEDASVRVLLLEAGAIDSSPFLHMPGTGFLVGSTPTYNWGFVSEPIPQCDNRRMTILQGKVLGGSSSINGMIYTRGHSHCYDAWRQMGCDGWSFADVLPYFKKAEGSERGASEWHGGEGPFRTRMSTPNLMIADAFLEASIQTGIPQLDDHNCDAGEGFGYYDVNIANGRRMSAAVAYIHPHLSRPNLTLMTRAFARRVVIDNGRAAGVEIWREGKVEIVRAKCEVILSAGAIKTPQLLLLSGIGPAKELAAIGIEPKVDSPRVGKGYQNHPCFRMQYRCSAPVTAKQFLEPAKAIVGLCNYIFRRKGPLAESFVTAGGFLKTDRNLEHPDAQVVLLAALMPKPRQGKEQPWHLLPREHGISLTIYQGTPYSRGEIRLGSDDPEAPPLIMPNYFDDPRDMDVLMRALRRVREVMRQPAIARYVSEELAPGPETESDDRLCAAIRAGVATAYHQSGTCAMGAQADFVVDPKLKVRGVDALRVVDASVIPLIPNAALHGPVIMIGEKAAAMIRKDWRL